MRIDNGLAMVPSGVRSGWKLFRQIGRMTESRRQRCHRLEHWQPAGATNMNAKHARRNAVDAKEADRIWQLLFLSWLVAIFSTLAVLFIGEVMGQAPCVLCWFQRAFMFPLAVILGLACYLSDPGIWRYGLPLAGIGGVIAAYHTLLVAGVIPTPLQPCGAGVSCTSEDMMIFSIVPIPLLAVGAFGTIIVLLLLVRKGMSHD